MAISELESPSRHALHEDVLAIVIGTAIVALGITLFREATLVTGSTAGIALLLDYATGLGFGILFFVVNLPFYVLALVRMGWRFTLKTVAAVALVSVYSAFIPYWLDVARIEPLFGALAGGALLGLGMLVLFRHKASMGGVNILALFLQERFGIRAGYFQLAVDVVVLGIAVLVIPLDRVLLSLLGAVVLNLIIGMNHKPGRYVGFS